MQYGYSSEWFAKHNPEDSWGAPSINSLIAAQSMPPTSASFLISALLSDNGICVGMKNVNLNRDHPNLDAHHKLPEWYNHKDVIGQMHESHMWSSHSYTKYAKTMYSHGDYASCTAIQDHLDRIGQTMANDPPNASIDSARNKSFNYLSNYRPYPIMPMMDSNQIGMHDQLPAASTASSHIIGAQPAITPAMRLPLFGDSKSLDTATNQMAMSGVNPLTSLAQPERFSRNTQQHALPPSSTTPPFDPMYSNVFERYLIRNRHVAAPKKKWIHDYLMSK